MKLYVILSTAVLAAGSLFSDDPRPDYGNSNLAAREINPQSMDPTRLSVLAVLKTAIPCSAHAPQSTGGMESWYSQLPADVKTLLPSLYPASATASASAAVSTSPGSAYVAHAAVSVIFTDACATSTTTSTTYLTTTHTVYYKPSPTGSNNSSTIHGASTGTGVALNNTHTTPSATSGIMRSATPQPSPFTGGADKVLEVKTTAAFVWVGIAAIFVLFC